MKALLDGDIYAFRPAAASEGDPLEIAIHRMEEMIDNTLAETGADEFSIFLSGPTNFRYQIYPEYKANRKAEKPRHLKDLKNYLVEKYGAVVSDGCEADDLLGIAQCTSLAARNYKPTGASGQMVFEIPNETIICSLDKDLRMIPGNHYSFEIRGPKWVRPMEIAHVEPIDGLRHFYTQVLTGDPSDNIKGASGIGKVKAGKILSDCTTEAEMFDAVDSCFSSDEELLMTGQCLWIFRKEKDIWQFPKFTS